MNNKFEVFKSIKLKDTYLVYSKKNNFFWKYCLDNNLVTIQDLVDLCRKHIQENKCNLYTTHMCGLLNLYAYKYCNVFSEKTIHLLNDKFVYLNERSLHPDVIKTYKKFCYLGLAFADCRFLYEFSYQYSSPGKTIIEYLRELVENYYRYLMSDTLNTFKLLIEYYDEYQKNINNFKEISQM